MTVIRQYTGHTFNTGPAFLCGLLCGDNVSIDADIDKITVVFIGHHYMPSMSLVHASALNAYAQLFL